MTTLSLTPSDIDRMRTLLHGAAQGPFDWITSGKPGSNGDFNVYIVDKNARKIMAVWGVRGEKEATADLVIMLMNHAIDLIEHTRAAIAKATTTRGV